MLSTATPSALSQHGDAIQPLSRQSLTSQPNNDAAHEESVADPGANNPDIETRKEPEGVATHNEHTSDGAIKNKGPARFVRTGVSYTKKGNSGNDFYGLNRKLHIRRVRAQNDKEHERSIRRAYQEHVRAQKNTWEPDWRVVLADLSKHTPKNEKWLNMALTISLPEHAARRLLYAIDDNLWEIASRYGCSVEICELASLVQDYRKIRLSGSANAISKSAADILQVAPEAKMQAVTTGLLPANAQAQSTSDNLIVGEEMQRPRDGIPRLVMSLSRAPMQIKGAKRVPEPEEWTQENFATYVSDLTSIEVPNHLHQYMYQGRKVHIDTVVENLHRIFFNPDCGTSLSRKAFNIAMGFFIKTNHISDARIFFVHMEMKKIPMDVETFNILLRGAAKNQDLHNFHFIFFLMLRRHCSPNDKTWIVFLMLVYSLRVKLYTLEKMRERGLLHDIETIKEACEHIVTHEINASLDSSHSEAEFLTHMDSRYGPFWLTVNSSNRIIHELGARGLISRCVDFLYAMEDRHIPSDQVSVNTILNHCKQSTNVVGALEVLRNIPSSSNFIPDEMTYHVLFEMAWRRKSFNLARVVWRYACLNAATTRSMRNQVAMSLRNSIRLRWLNLSPRQFFQKAAGLFITAIRHHRDHPVRIFQQEFKDILGFEALAYPPADKEAYAYYSDAFDVTRFGNTIIPSTSDGEHSSSESQFPKSYALDVKSSIMKCDSLDKNIFNLAVVYDSYYKFLGHDCDVFQWWKPVRPMVEMLVEAWELDQKWINDPEKRANKNKVDWRLDGAITVPLKATINRQQVTMEWK